MEAHTAATIVASMYDDAAERQATANRADEAIHALHVAGKECLKRANPGLALSFLFRAATALPFLMRQNSRAPVVVLCDIATALQDLNEFKLAAHHEAAEACPAADPEALVPAKRHPFELPRDANELGHFEAGDSPPALSRH